MDHLSRDNLAQFFISYKINGRAIGRGRRFHQRARADLKSHSSRRGMIGEQCPPGTNWEFICAQNSANLMQLRVLDSLVFGNNRANIISSPLLGVSLGSFA